MALIIPQILFPLLGVWGLHEIFTKKISKEDALKYLKIAAGVTIGLTIVGGILSDLWQSFDGEAIAQLKQQLASSFKNPAKENELISAMKKDMAGAARTDGIYALGLVLAGVVLLWAFIKEKASAAVVGALLSIIVFADLFNIGTRYLKNDLYWDKDQYEAEMFSPRPVDNEILLDKNPYYRVQDLSTNTYNDAKPAYFHKLVGGYHPAKMEIYQDLIDVQLSKQNSAVYNMLNTRYFIIPNQGQQGSSMLYPFSKLTATGVVQTKQNPNACGNAWFVREIKKVNTADEEMLALDAPGMFGDTNSKGNFNPLQTAIVRKDFDKEITATSFVKDTSAAIKLTKYGLNDLEFESNNTNNGFGVFSDIYYKGGWSCLIDGKAANIIRTNYVLRGVNIPAGKHKIEFHFLPPQANIGRTLGTIGSILILLIFGFGMFMHIKAKEEVKDIALD